MNVQINVEHLKHIGIEMNDISKQLSKLLPRLDETERELKKQTEFGSCLRALDLIREDMDLERYHVNLLSQALMNIGSEYSRTEIKIEDAFEELRPESVRMDIGAIDLTKIYGRAKHLLYGGET